MAKLEWKTTSFKPTSGSPPLKVSYDLDWIGGTAPFTMTVDPEGTGKGTSTTELISEKKGQSFTFKSAGTFKFKATLKSKDGQEISHTETIKVEGSAAETGPKASSSRDVDIDIKDETPDDTTIRYKVNVENKAKDRVISAELWAQAIDSDTDIPVFIDKVDSINLSKKDDDDESFTITGLKPGTRYQVSIWAQEKNNGDVISSINKRTVKTTGSKPVIEKEIEIAGGGNPLTEPVDIEGLIKQAVDAVAGPGTSADLSQANQASADQLKKSIQDAIENTIKPAMKEAAAEMEKLLEIAKPIDIEDAFAKASATGIGGMTTGFIIYLITSLTDLLHPVKGTGIVPMGIDLTKALGTDLISRNIVGTYANVAVEGPLRLYYNERARAWRPRGAEADDLYFKGLVTKDQWRQYYAWSGWPDDLIDKRFKTMFRDPDSRFLLGLFDDPEIPEDWIRLKLKELGFNQEDIDVLVQFALRKSNERTREASKGTIVKRYREGYIDDSQALTELRDARYNDDEILQILRDAYLQRDTERREDRLAFVKRAFQTDVIDLDEFIEAVQETIVDVDQAEYLVSTEIYKKNPKKKK